MGLGGGALPVLALLVCVLLVGWGLFRHPRWITLALYHPRAYAPSEAQDLARSARALPSRAGWTLGPQGGVAEVLCIWFGGNAMTALDSYHMLSRLPGLPRRATVYLFFEYPGYGMHRAEVGRKESVVERAVKAARAALDAWPTVRYFSAGGHSLGGAVALSFAKAWGARGDCLWVSRLLLSASFASLQRTSVHHAPPLGLLPSCLQERLLARESWEPERDFVSLVPAPLCVILLHAGHDAVIPPGEGERLEQRARSALEHHGCLVVSRTVRRATHNNLARSPVFERALRLLADVPSDMAPRTVRSALGGDGHEALGSC